MSSDSATRITLALVERFLREHGLDESRASVVHDVLTSSQIITNRDTERCAETPSGPPTLAETRSSGVPTMAGVAQTVLAVPSPVMSDASGSFRPPAARLVPGAVIGTGGMGEVCRVEDASLRRTLAMKILLADLADEPALRERFVAEAQVTAQLAHPNIPPVHEIGELSDGRPYFTMKEVRGVTLAQVLDEAHRDPLGATRWSEQRRLELFQKVCAAVAYAHARGVAHCDLKPANVMVGAFGEVQVMDWGVARLVGASGTTSSDEPPVSLEGLAAVQSIVAGTPAYMAPEQALGLGELIGPASDVYALGVMLFEVLAGERPYRGTARELVQQAQSGPVPPLPRRGGSVADDALYAIITRAMAADPAERFADAKAMDAELARWREGAMRREKAAAIVAQARTMAVTIEPTFARAAELREQAIAALDRLDPEAPVEAKEPIWTVLDEASERARTATLRQVQAEQLLVQALGQSPELDEAKALIASMRHGRHVDAERRRAWDEAARHELVLRQYDTGAFRDYLEGRAPLTVATQPRCRAKLYRVVERARRLVTELVRDLGTTPITNVELPVGSYLLELLSSDRPPVFYPIVLRRRGAWPGVRPGDSTPFSVRLPEEGAVASGEIYVPAGCAELGGDDDARNGRPAQRVWVDGFVVQEHPVTYADLGAFLASPTGEPYRRGVFRDGATVWRHDWPAVGVSWDAARAYAAWLARETGKLWRLPTEIEWEKAARGVDGRFYPWGDFADAVFSHSRTQGRIPASPTSIHAFDLDRSPYGGRGFGGNVRDWCVDAANGRLSVVDGCAVAPPLVPEAVERIVRGGSFRLPPEGARVAARSALVAAIGHADVGIRLVRSW